MVDAYENHLGSFLKKVISTVHSELRISVLGKPTLATYSVNQDSLYTIYLWKIHRMKEGHQVEQRDQCLRKQIECNRQKTIFFVQKYPQRCERI